MNKEYHVAKNGNDNQNGSVEQPFLTINRAAQVATAGNTIIVHEGVYREWVNPVHEGLSNQRRITYQAAPGEKVVIKGSEHITGWEPVQDGVWKVTLAPSFFGDFNPYQEEVFGDWLVASGSKKHLGDVYLNGMSFYEADAYEDLFHPVVQTKVTDHWTQQVVPILNPEQTKYIWFAKVDEQGTTLFANFHDCNPNEEFVEINVRKACFYPKKTGVDYITVRGFEFAQAACPWTPPTSHQVGMVGTNWSKGWIIEDNILHDAKCSAISIGKEESTGHQYHSIRQDKTGHQYQLESVFSAQQIGWKKETIGSHLIQNNTIYDCGQNGIVGHLGCVFSKIRHNHIYNIALKREFYGHEIAGIKLHAAIDVEILENRIHDCSLGTWLDWQTQGTRVSKNVYYQNSRDLFVEVSHGPYVVDHNIFASPVEMDNFAQGGAYVHNLFCGYMNIQNVLDRATPYHYPHSTEVAGYAFVYSGDDRYMNNIFIQQHPENTAHPSGTAGYNGFPSSLKEYLNAVRQDRSGIWNSGQAVYIENNAYFNGATAFDQEKNKLVLDSFQPNLRIEEKETSVFLSIDLPEEYNQLKGYKISTATLPPTRLVGAEFEQPDGSDLSLDTDFFDDTWGDTVGAGPFQFIQPGTNVLKIWDRKKG
ncbi:right-handed parallel beta-helix repeat-containing protein [Jeotgalibaca caeni]|uniref:right-handed parallel beta-helix repeat-containing protein n=1 Tax=Jeotgalibaca caeni TaxID=3028623 RepID=UPI00237DE6C2|nr:right-handed parallel beta-helix repeat-containing protein [Jeotgalibaca caeni]MDE1549077.1 right-handed parallel beta-helix repeat-containing protein [Jeotgalibaca caeni]